MNAGSPQNRVSSAKKEWMPLELAEKEVFRRMARFFGIENYTYMVMANHFHILPRTHDGD